MTPKALIRQAQKNLFFAAIQGAAMENGLFKYTDLPDRFYWTVDGETRLLEWKNRSEKDFRIDITNQLRAALAIAVIQVSSVFDDCFGKKRLEDPDEGRRAARCIVHQIRCCFAHHPLEPKWDIKASYRQVFSVPSVNFTLDLRQLHGKPLKKEDINWFKLFDLLEYCITLVL